ncbi:unnamed protein product [Auanema sp. JU1783]|nr:unnamed protein product [Auanema sp. JU1783]
MYGLIIDNIVTCIREKYGLDVWNEIKYVAGLSQDAYGMDEVYSEGLAHKLIWACHDVTNDTIDAILNDAGKSFYTFLAKYEFHKIVRVLGRTFPQFLNGLDNLHEYLRFSFPKLKPPSFYCEHESRTGLTLHYRSKRRGFLHYVQGQIKNIAKELFETDVEIELLDHEQDNSMEHVIMRLHFNNIHFIRHDRSYHNQLAHLSSEIRITSDIFFDIFPFIIVFNRGMRIRNVGIGLLRVMSNLVGKKINQQFLLMRPFIRFRWEEIMLHSNNIFELMSNDPIIDEDDESFTYKHNDPDQMTEIRSRMTEKEKEKFLSLKGQMFYMEEWESICFMGIPVMSNLGQMYKSGLFINDFALHDSSRDLVLASTQQAAELKLLLHQEAQKSQNMTENMVKLKAERRRADQLLYQMLPKSVANMLRNGESAVACCENFESVSIVFTDVVGFTNICSTIEPLEVVDFLNLMYTKFDGVIDTHDVYKVETIGDAYMVVSGAPNRTVHDAEYAIDSAMSFIREVQSLEGFRKEVVINIRAGVHSGSVVAGVVGLKMPRYCLFGDTVVLANAMEANSKPMRTKVSQATASKIEEYEPNLFKFEQADIVEVKGVSLQTYLVSGKNGNARVPTPRSEIVSDDDEYDDELDELSKKVSKAHQELKKNRGKSTYTPISDAEIESFSRASRMSNMN